MLPRFVTYFIALSFSRDQHVCADTLRSAAVLVAAAIATLIPSIPPSIADAVAAVVVSVIIVGSLVPLIQGLIMTAIEVISLSRNPPRDGSESAAQPGDGRETA
jgi:hypothetical protein